MDFEDGEHKPTWADAAFAAVITALIFATVALFVYRAIFRH